MVLVEGGGTHLKNRGRQRIHSTKLQDQIGIARKESNAYLTLEFTLQDAAQQGALDTPVTRLEKQMKHDAGMEGTSDGNLQWRTIANHVIHGQGSDQVGQPLPKAAPPSCDAAFAATRKASSFARSQEVSADS